MTFIYLILLISWPIIGILYMIKGQLSLEEDVRLLHILGGILGGYYMAVIYFVIFEPDVIFDVIKNVIKKINFVVVNGSKEIRKNENT